jgi:hypothetical protein
MDPQLARRSYWKRLSLLIGLALATVGNRAAAESKPPLAGLPSTPGKHIEKIKALADNTWLNLGSPAADPKWGKGRGRSWSSRMAYAPDLRAAFLFGEGVHAWWNKQNNRYMDDLFVYDIMAHRWVCAHPGTEVTAVKLKLDRNGIEVDENGRPVPVAQLSHGYEQLTYDTDRRRFMFMPGSSQDWQASPFGKRRLARWRRSWLATFRRSTSMTACEPLTRMLCGLPAALQPITENAKSIPSSFRLLSLKRSQNERSNHRKADSSRGYERIRPMELKTKDTSDTKECYFFRVVGVY